MSINNSASSNYSPPSLTCSQTVSRQIYFALNLTNIVLLFPLCISVLSLGFQQWKQQRSVVSTAVMTFYDFFTYNMAVIELIGVLGNTISICGLFVGCFMMSYVGGIMGAFPWIAQMLFPILTCLERYLAVVHPMTYLQLKQEGGVRIRNVITGVVWFECFVGVGFLFFMMSYPEYLLLPYISLLAFSLSAVTFLSISVLCVLSRPRPGEVARDGVHVDQPKRRAFHTVITVMGLLVLKFAGNLVCTVVGFSQTFSHDTRCIAQAVTSWFNLPSSLVLPLLFLHRAGKLPICKDHKESA